MLTGITPEPGVEGVEKSVFQFERLRRACSEFESIYITQMLKTMRSTLVEDGPLGNSHESKIMKSMFDENLAQGVARGGGIGLGRALFEKLKEIDPGPAPALEGKGDGKSVSSVQVSGFSKSQIPWPRPGIHKGFYP